MGKKEDRVTKEGLLRDIEKVLESRFGDRWGSPDFVEDWVNDYFERLAKQYMEEIVGLERSFGELKVRYNSPLKEVFKDLATQKGKAMAAQLLREEGLPKLNKKERKDLIREFKEYYVDSIERIVRQEGRALAENLVKKHLFSENFDPAALQADLENVTLRINSILDLAAAAEKSWTENA